MKRFTVADKLLVAALSLDAGERRSFTAEELVVAAWTYSPETFGLRGILDEDGRPIYPDSNRVFAEIMGSKPLRRDGYIDKVGHKTYQLTEAGRRRGARLEGKDAPDRARRGLDRQLQDDLRRLHRSRAASKGREGRRADITFHDACGFWGISPASTANLLEARLAHVDSVLAEALEYTQEDSLVLDARAGLLVTPEDLLRLGELSTDMLRMFASDLDVIRSRDDERRQ